MEKLIFRREHEDGEFIFFDLSLGEFRQFGFAVHCLVFSNDPALRRIIGSL